MTALEIYDHFKINQGLREHMLRVAGVASCITADADVIQAALVHDLGNIVKTRFEVPALFQPEGIEYYREVQQAIFEKYGADDHTVTEAMMCEIGVAENIRMIAAATGVTTALPVQESDGGAEKIMMYADMRVGMNGVLSLQERLTDLEARTVPERYNAADFSVAAEALIQIETEIFADLGITPADITTEVAETYIPELLQTEITGTVCA